MPELSTLHGEALDAALARQFSVATERIELPGFSYVLHKPENSDHLISEADYVMDERLPYWADLWPSAHVLAMTIRNENGEGRRLLELGCGLGLPTIAAMDAGFSVTATDYYEPSIHMTRANAWRNLGREPAVRLVNWRMWPEDIGTFDVVMAADVIYETEYATLVGACIARALAPDGVALVADPGRLALPRFREHLAEVGLVIIDTTTTPFERPPVKQQIQVMRIAHTASTVAR